MKTFLRGLITAVILTSFHNAQADAVKTASAEKAKYKDTTVLDFSEASVDGEFLRPDAHAVKGEKNLFFDSMLDPRANFKNELKRSSGAIR